MPTTAPNLLLGRWGLAPVDVAAEFHAVAVGGLMKVPGFLSFRRWENYALLAMASIAFLVGTAVRVDAINIPTSTERVVAKTKIKSEHRNSEAYWVKRHKRIMEKAGEMDKVDVLFLGDSITHGFENNYIWNYHFKEMKVLNAGISSDRVEHMLWRIDQGLIKQAKPKVVVFLGGVNNLGMASPEHTAAGVATIIEKIKKDSPQTKILVQGVFPAGKLKSDKKRGRITKLNKLLSEYDDGANVRFIDFGHKFLGSNGSISRKIMFDYLHLTSRGYHIWATSLSGPLAQMLGRDTNS